MLGISRLCLARLKSETHSWLRIRVSSHKNCFFFSKPPHTHKAVAIFGMSRSAFSVSLKSVLALLSGPLSALLPHLHDQRGKAGVGGGGTGQSVPSILPELSLGSGQPAQPLVGLISQPLCRQSDSPRSSGTLGFCQEEHYPSHLTSNLVS